MLKIVKSGKGGVRLKPNDKSAEEGAKRAEDKAKKAKANAKTDEEKVCLYVCVCMCARLACGYDTLLPEWIYMMVYRRRESHRRKHPTNVRVRVCEERKVFLFEDPLVRVSE